MMQQSAAVPCAVEGCDRPAWQRGWCQMHYSRWYRSGSLGEPSSRRTPVAAQRCKADGCLNPVIANGECNVHRIRMRQYGTYELVRPPRGTCEYPGCGRPHAAQGWCAYHFRLVVTEGRDPLDVRPYGRSACSVQDCDAEHYCQDLCKLHYQRWLRTGDPGGLDLQVARYNGAPCGVRGCVASAQAQGMCVTHYVIFYSQPKRRAQKREAAGADYFSPEASRARCEYYDYRCWVCGAPATAMDHVKPPSKGGSQFPANLRPACLHCNAIKGDRWPYPTSSYRGQQRPLGSRDHCHREGNET
jgi:5-methylcytosine-specific restriction endonuclease McrA